jgi:predicted permease
MVLFALIFTPQSYIIYHAVRYGAQLRSICLIVMLVMALAKPLPEAQPYKTDRLEQV